MADEIAEPLAQISGLVVEAAVRLRLRYMVTGMFASNHWLERAGMGRRPSYDVDFSILGPREQVDSLARELQKRHGWTRVRDSKDQILLRVGDTGFSADLLKAILPEEAATPEEAALSRFFESAYGRSVVRSVGGKEVRLQRPEDILVVKAMLGRPKDVADMRLLHELPNLDRAYLRRQLESLGFYEAYLRVVGGAPGPRR